MKTILVVIIALIIGACAGALFMRDHDAAEMDKALALVERQRVLGASTSLSALAKLEGGDQPGAAFVLTSDVWRFHLAHRKYAGSPEAQDLMQRIQSYSETSAALRQALAQGPQ